jgi:hypothetical protein
MLQKSSLQTIDTFYMRTSLHELESFTCQLHLYKLYNQKGISTECYKLLVHEIWKFHGRRKLTVKLPESVLSNSINRLVRVASQTCTTET